MVWFVIFWIVMTMGFACMFCGKMIASRIYPDDPEKVETLGYSISRISSIVGMLGFAGVGVMIISTPIMDKLLVPADDANHSLSVWYDITLLISIFAALGLRSSLRYKSAKQNPREFKLLGQQTDMVNLEDHHDNPATDKPEEQTRKGLFIVSLSVLILSQIAMLVLAIVSYHS